jgi:hypothetical protein
MPPVRDRRPQRPKAARPIVVDGRVIRAGESIPRGAMPLRDIDRLGSHGYVDRRPGDNGLETG